MQTVAIAGVGLIGASFGLALRSTGFSGDILGVSSPAAIDAGLAAGAISEAVSLAEAAERADLIYLAQPVDRLLGTIAELGKLARPETLITDAGSTKAVIVRQAEQYLAHARFIGGHPMAGKESRGAQSADASLFRNRPYILTPGPSSYPSEFRSLLESMGAVVLEMPAEEHDSVVSLTSHLPQLLSTSLAAYLAQDRRPELQKVFGSGLLDMTRLALSPHDLWDSILATNRANVKHAIRSYILVLQQMLTDLETGTTTGTFRSANLFAMSIRKLNS